MSKKNQGNKAKAETTEVEKVDSSISIAPEAKETPSFEEAYEMVKSAKAGVKAKAEECDNREIHIALTDIDKNLSLALKNFKFIDMSLSTND